MNLLLDTDSYKVSHAKQYPPGTDGMFSYLESRGGKYDQTVFYGLQYYLKKYLTQRITREMVMEAYDFNKLHGEPFNLDGWLDIVKRLGGRIPIEIRAVPEGAVVPNHNILLSGESTDERHFWVASWFETLIMRLWYPITVATQSWHIRQTILDYLERTGDPSQIDLKLHDFGSRGVSSQESAQIGGSAHLVNFLGSDTIAGVWCANNYYNSGMAGFSIPASEHSTMTAWGRENEVDAYRNMLKLYGKEGAIFACVSDSYDIFNACEAIWGGELKEEVINSGATVVVRPDSGDPPEVVAKCLDILGEKFGFTTNKKGFKVLNHVRVIQGDGIDEDMIQQILDRAIVHGWSADNVNFGMGGALLQKVNRDTQKFAYKCSEVTVDGRPQDVYKEPVTDPGKKSKRGRLDLVNIGDGKIATVSGTHPHQSLMRRVFSDGEILVEDSFEKIRDRSRKGLTVESCMP